MTTNTFRMIEQSIQVHFHYAVHFTDGLFEPSNPLLRDVVRQGGEAAPSKALFVVDQQVCDQQPGLLAAITAYCSRHQDAITLVRPPLVLPGGACAGSDPGHVWTLHEAICAAGLGRRAFVVAVGGGALLDLAGYAAATALRGIRLIRVPTTLLAQSYAALGVTNSAAAFGDPHFLGTCAPPYAVVNDLDLLGSLPARDWRAGMAEALRVSLHQDADFFAFLDQRSDALLQRDEEAVRHMIHRCAELRLGQIASSADPFDQGESRPLEFGTWAARELERLAGDRLRHGEAVALGLALDSTYSYLAGLLLRPAWKRIINVLLGFEFTLYTPELRALLEQGHPPAVTLLRQIGQAVAVRGIDEALVKESVAILEDIAISYPAPQAEQQAPADLAEEAERQIGGATIQPIAGNARALGG